MSVLLFLLFITSISRVLVRTVTLRALRSRLHTAGDIFKVGAGRNMTTFIRVKRDHSGPFLRRNVLLPHKALCLG